MTAAKVMECCCKTIRLWRTNNWRSICPQNLIGARSQIAKNSKIRMSRRMDTSTTQDEILDKHWRQWYLSKVIYLDMSFCSSKTKIILIGKYGWHQNDWKKSEYGSHVEKFDENIISWSRIFGMYFPALTSTDHSSTYRETCSGEIDFRIQGLHHWTDQQEDHTRKEAVKTVDSSICYNPTWGKIEHTTHSGRSRRTWRTWRCARSPKVQWLHCMTNWTKGIAYYTCGTCLRLLDNKAKIKQGSIRCFVDSKLIDEERSISRCTSRKHREAKNSSRSSRLSP